MKVLLVTQWFNPEPNNMKGLTFAQELKKRGLEVEVLTGFPNYPTGKIYDGYKLRLYQKEEMDGITVHRVWLYPSHDGNKWKRMANYFSFGIAAGIIGSIKVKGHFDVVYVYHPPVTSTIAAFRIARKKKAKTVLDINDLWPDSISATGMMQNKRLLGIIGKWCFRTYKKADAINVLSKGIQTDLIERGVPPEKINVIPVWCNESVITDHIDRQFSMDHRCPEHFTVMYAGAIGAAQGLDVLVRVAEKLADDYPQIQIILIGTGTCADDIRKQIEKSGLQNISLLPPIPSERIAETLNCADALFVHLKKDPLFEHSVPSKIPMYMMLKKPLIAGLEGDAADIVRQAGCGAVCAPEDENAIAAAIVNMFGMDDAARNLLAVRGLDYYQKNLSLDSGISKFYRLFTSLSDLV